MYTAYAIYKICTYYMNSEFKFVQGQKKKLYTNIPKHSQPNKPYIRSTRRISNIAVGHNLVSFF